MSVECLIVKRVVGSVIAVFGMSLGVCRVPDRETHSAVGRLIAVFRMGLGVRRVPDRETLCCSENNRSFRNGSCCP